MRPTKKIATIDIGTNSVLLTVAEQQSDGTWRALCEEAHITRIGEGLGANPGFLPHAMERTAALLEQYLKRCKEFHIDQIIAVGTAAFRRAVNARDFVAQIEKQLGISIEIISGEREAELSYLAASHDFGDDLLVMDIGGGSTEFIWRHPPQLQALSLPLGSVVLHERLVSSDPISESDFIQLQTYIMTELLNVQGSRWGGGAAAMKQTIPEKLVALAGTATTLAAMQLKLATYSHAEVHGTELSEADVAALLQQLRDATIEERKQIPGVEAARADIILEGTLILHETMKLFGYESVTISDRGVRWGLIY